MRPFTAVYQAVPEGYIAFVEELPGANVQASSLDEARLQLREAVESVLDANRILAEEQLSRAAASGTNLVVREPFSWAFSPA